VRGACLTAPDGSTNTYNYDTLNRLSTLTNSLTGQFGFGYDALSRRTQLTRPNGINTNYSYDSVSRLLSVLHQAGSTTLDVASYGYDYAGNRTSKTNYLNNISEGYTYDPIYQLTQVTQGASTTESYSYDAVGNRLSSQGVNPYSYNTSNQLTATPSGSYTYDNNGNTLTDASGKTYTWDFENRLVQVVNPGVGTTTFRYDPFGRRSQKSGPLGATNYLYDGAALLEELNNSGNVLARYSQGALIDEPLSVLRSGTTNYYQADGIGTVTSLSNSTGGLANTYTYDAFGKLTGSTGTVMNTFQFTGREWDNETGLHYYRARFYDAATGRFLSEDQLRFGSGSSDFYPYVSNRPLNNSDPSGLCRIEVRFALLGSICGKQWYHAYIITSGDGITSFFRGGPHQRRPGGSSGGSSGYSSGSSTGSSRSCCSGSSNSSHSSSGSPFGTIETAFGTYLPDTVDWETKPVPTMTVLDNAAPCDTYDTALTLAMQAIQNANTTYDPFVDNSNAVVTTALSDAGLQYGPPPVWAPGWGHSLPEGGSCCKK
jgi:RHS repeat-associated protein